MKKDIMQRPDGPKTPKLLNTFQAIIRPVGPYFTKSLYCFHPREIDEKLNEYSLQSL